MLSRKKRIPKEFFKKQGQPKFFSGNLLTLNLQKKEGESRVGFIVSKKVSKSAVERNRLRRMGYAAIEPLLSKIPKGSVCFFYFKKQEKKITSALLQREIEKIFQNAKFFPML